jgi:hypothetical protein
MRKQQWVAAGIVVAVALLGCKKVKQLTGRAAAGTTQASGEKKSAASPAQPALIAGAAPGPAGVQWQRTNHGGVGSVEMPTGAGWTKESGPAFEMHHEKLDITAMIQVQPAVPADARGEYLSSLIDVNKRDAPKYAVVAKVEGGVGPNVAGRVDGKFDNGTAYATRDYVLFVKGAALALMVRGPVARTAEVQSIADHMATSYR